MKSSKVGLAAAGFALLALPALAQDLTILSKETSSNGPEKTTTQYLTKERMRHNGGEHDSMVEYATGRIVNIDHKKKEYSEITLAEMEAAMKNMSAEMEKANAQLQNLPPAVREKMEAMMGGAAGAVTVTKGGTKKIAGYDAQQYTIAMGPSMKSELWNTTALQFPLPEADFKKFASVGSGMAAMANNPMFKSMSRLMDEMKKVQGFTLASTTQIQIMGKSNTTSREVVEIKQSPVPASVFEIPAGYKKVDSPMKMGAKK